MGTRLSFKGCFKFSDEHLLEAGMNALGQSEHVLTDDESIQRNGLGLEILCEEDAPTRLYYATLFALEELARHAQSGTVTAIYEGVGTETQTIRAAPVLAERPKKRPTARSLLEAVRAGDDDLLEVMLQDGGDPNVVDPTDIDRTLLHMAAHQGSARMVVALLNAGARVKRDGHGGLPLHEAKSAAVVRLLIEEGVAPDTPDPFGRTPLERVAFMGYAEAARALIEEGADMMRGGGVKLLAAASEGGVAWLAERLLDEGVDVNSRTPDGWTPLGVAVTWGRVEIAELLISRGANLEIPPQPGFTLLHLAAQHESMLELLGRLLEGDVDIETTVEASVGGGYTGLMMAVRRGCVPVVELLLAHGADVNHQGQGIKSKSPLMVAASHGNVEMIDLLVSAGASIDARTGDGFTALLHAASLGYREACERLLALGADPAARNDHGYASWDLAMDWQLGALLKAAGE